MSERLNAFEGILHAINHKLTSYLVGGGMVGVSVSAQQDESRLRTLNEIPILELFSHPMSAAVVFGMIGAANIIYQVSKDIFSFCAKRRAAKRRSMKRRAEDKNAD